MIRRTVSAVFLLRDGFTGRALNGNTACCRLDGAPLRKPVWKPGGYLVLTDLLPGPHSLRVTGTGYQDEAVSFVISEGKPMTDTVTLKPGLGYPFPAETVNVRLLLRRGELPAAGEQLWLGILPRTRLKLAQDKAEAGDASIHLYCDGNASGLPVPGHFLMLDRKKPELVYLHSVSEETGRFTEPLAFPHPRGTELIPMQTYVTDEKGGLLVRMQEPRTLIGFCGGRIRETALHAGEQTVEWNLEE